MESHIPSAVQSLHLIAHVFKEQLVFVQVHLQPASQQTQQELQPGCWNHALGENGHYRDGNLIQVRETGNCLNKLHLGC